MVSVSILSTVFVGRYTFGRTLASFSAGISELLCAIRLSDDSQTGSRQGGQPGDMIVVTVREDDVRYRFFRDLCKFCESELFRIHGGLRVDHDDALIAYNEPAIRSCTSLDPVNTVFQRVHEVNRNGRRLGRGQTSKRTDA